MQGQTGPSFNVCLGGRGEATQGYVSRCGGAGRVLEHNEIMDMDGHSWSRPFYPSLCARCETQHFLQQRTQALSSVYLCIEFCTYPLLPRCGSGSSLLRSFVSDPPEVSSPTADTAAQVTLGMTNLWLSSTLLGGVKA